MNVVYLQNKIFSRVKKYDIKQSTDIIVNQYEKTTFAMLLCRSLMRNYSHLQFILPSIDSPPKNESWSVSGPDDVISKQKSFTTNCT